MRSFSAFLCLFLLAPPCAASAWESRTRSVHDGDSINVVNAEGALVNIRLYGIDAPETRQPYGQQAKKRLGKLVARKHVRIEVLDTDRYGRNVALVRTADGTLANEEMVRAGLAWVYDEYCTRDDICQPLRTAQAEARTAGRGLWADSEPTPPWQWRKQHKTEEWYAKPARVLKKIARKIKIVLR